MEDIEQAGNPLTPRRSSRIASKSPRVSQLGFSQTNLGLSSEKEEEEKSPKEMMAANYTTKKAKKWGWLAMYFDLQSQALAQNSTLWQFNTTTTTLIMFYLPNNSLTTYL